MKLLFVCLAHTHRSPTAEELVRRAGRHEARSCGMDAFSDVPVSAELLRWADKIFVMEAYMKDALEEKFRHEKPGDKIEILDIPDIFLRNDPRLIAVLRQKLKAYLYVFRAFAAFAPISPFARRGLSRWLL